MKHPVFIIAALLLFGNSTSGQAQVEIPPAGGGAYHTEPTVCLTDEQRAAIATMLTGNEQKLRQEGKISPDEASNAVSFDWPLKAAPGLDWNNFAILSNYLDQNQSQTLLDFNCGARTYDGHQGTDISLWPFAWHLKNNNLVHVVAAEAGIIIGKQDGNTDENCVWGNQSWNAVYVRHGDGSVAWYGHMKQFSLTSKPIGATVSKGEYLGVVASSGVSSGPHLHFEVYRQTPYMFSNLVDPYSGVCNSTNPDGTWWATQEPYWKPTLNAALTHNAPPEHGCPSGNENPHFSDHFLPGGGLLYTAVYFRDQQQGQFTSMRLRAPNGSLWKSWGHSSPETYPGSWWWWSWTLPTNGPFGTWAFEATFNGQTVVHPFVYGNLVSTDSEDLDAKVTLTPNPSTGTFRLKSSEYAQVEVQVFDGMGRLRFSGMTQTNQDMTLDELEAGVYVVRVLHADRTYLLRLVRE